jgi:hypothetical protein
VVAIEHGNSGIPESLEPLRDSLESLRDSRGDDALFTYGTFQHIQERALELPLHAPTDSDLRTDHRVTVTLIELDDTRIKLRLHI